jgi:hypothetical protein
MDVLGRFTRRASRTALVFVTQGSNCSNQHRPCVVEGTDDTKGATEESLIVRKLLLNVLFYVLCAARPLSGSLAFDYEPD